MGAGAGLECRRYRGDAGETHAVLVETAALGLHKIVKQPVYGLVVVEHQEELHQRRQLCALEHLPCKRATQS